MRGAQIDFAARYREAAADENVVAIDAIGMTGDANDVELLRPFLTHKRTVIRRAAVKSIVRLGGARVVDDIAFSTTYANLRTISLCVGA